MESTLDIFVKAIFTENMIFAYFLGMCSYLAVSKTVKTGVGLGLAVVFVLVVTVPMNYLLENYVLKEGALVWLNPEYGVSGSKTIDLGFLSFIMFIAVVASIVQLVEMLVEKFAPALYGALGIFLPLIAVNCSILGGALFMQDRQYSTILDASAFALGSGIGWFIAIVSLAAIREKIRYSKVPPALRGLGITFIVTGLMGIAFMSFMGVEYGKKKEEKTSTVSTVETSQIINEKLEQ
ncbi:NADH:ubiquinone reductase (Na(+)-transporting) subunit E [Brumimicrobium sp.]|uniref:NADH:ubiquinone reductase (Na(+)-transporting) subunit E n=1 Tax=Brumimicrobium sp. TaxID=2029867 RepID=UPI00261AC2E3|nr:NADH:ubiquinone reductase (Na(+)-transporting) subunit E [uncultured Brumimicrobium sp.]